MPTLAISVSPAKKTLLLRNPNNTWIVDFVVPRSDLARAEGEGSRSDRGEHKIYNSCIQRISMQVFSWLDWRLQLSFTMMKIQERLKHFCGIVKTLYFYNPG